MLDAYEEIPAAVVALPLPKTVARGGEASQLVGERQPPMVDAVFQRSFFGK